jgi:hypothetical protein
MNKCEELLNLEKERNVLIWKINNTEQLIKLYESYLNGKSKPKYNAQDKDGKIVNIDHLEEAWFRECKNIPNITNLWKQTIEVNNEELSKVKKEIAKYY